MIRTIAQKLSLIFIFGELRKTGLTAFLLLGLLPFFGVILLGWEPSIILAGYFIDRIIYLLFCFVYDVIVLAKSSPQQNKLKKLFRTLAVFLVSGYMLLQFFVLITSLASTFSQPDAAPHLTTLFSAIIILYSIPFISGVKEISRVPKRPHSLNHYIGIVLISSFLFMISFVGGVFLVPVLQEHMLGYFFKNGYGIIIFLFVSLRMITDIFFFSFNPKKSIVGN